MDNYSGFNNFRNEDWIASQTRQNVSDKRNGMTNLSLSYLFGGF
jgi:hypothetical protein